jgi:hypothetical protein
MLTGVSIDYYVRMERGSLSGASDGVLEGVARALQLDDAERDHLFDLARGSQPQPGRLRRSREPGVTASVRQVLDAIGNDRARLLSVLTVLIPFIGYPRALNALRALDEVVPVDRSERAGS